MRKNNVRLYILYILISSEFCEYLISYFGFSYQAAAQKRFSPKGDD